MIQFFLEILNPEGHPSGITGSRVTGILLNAWILPVHGVSAVEGSCTLSRFNLLVAIHICFGH